MFNSVSMSAWPVWRRLRQLGTRAPQAKTAGVAGANKNTAINTVTTTASHDAAHPSGAVSVHFEGVGKRYESGELALSGIDLDIAAGEFVVLVGPSGCGKSSLLRMLAGLESISAGRMRIGAQVVNDISPRERDIAMVFQDYALYPHKNVYDNLAFGLQVRGVDNDEIARRVHEVATQLKIDDLLQRKPAALSGGQRQRVAIGRALVRKARLFLFDEPLSNLDVKLRNEMRVELKKLHQQFGITTLYVTHDQVEAMTLGDRIAVMSRQGIEQYGSPQQIYGQPRTTFVAEFVGSPAMNLLTLEIAYGPAAEGEHATSPAHAQAHAGVAVLGASRLPLPALLHAADGKPATQVILGVRPEHIQRGYSSGSNSSGSYSASASSGNDAHARSPDLASAQQADGPGLSATITFIEPLGAETIVTLDYAGHSLRARWAPDPALQAGQRVDFSIDARHCLWFDADSGLNLNATAHA